MGWATLWSFKNKNWLESSDSLHVSIPRDEDNELGIFPQEQEYIFFILLIKIQLMSFKNLFAGISGACV